MALTMRPTGLGHGVYTDCIDYSVFAGAWNIGRIYERRGFSDAVRFFWSLHGVVLTSERANERMALLHGHPCGRARSFSTDL
jgi:hypothetical protein